MKNQYNKTITACFVGYIVQAIVNNFTPLLFLFFQRSYQIPLGNAFVFARVPIAPLMEEGETGLQIKELFRIRVTAVNRRPALSKIKKSLLIIACATWKSMIKYPIHAVILENGIKNR